MKIYSYSKLVRPLVILLAVIFLVIVVNFDSIRSSFECNSYKKSGQFSRDKFVTIGGVKFDLELANTPEEQSLGLSNRPCLPSANSGMLFEFSEIGQHCFWMKDMRFSIDILWLNEQNIISKIEQNAAPESYPKTFCPKTASIKNVLELSAGTVQKLDLAPAQTIVL